MNLKLIKSLFNHIFLIQREKYYLRRFFFLICNGLVAFEISILRILLNICIANLFYEDSKTVV